MTLTEELKNKIIDHEWDYKDISIIYNVALETVYRIKWRKKKFCIKCWKQFCTKTWVMMCSYCRVNLTPKNKERLEIEFYTKETMEVTWLSFLQIKKLLNKIPHSTIRIMYKNWIKQKTLKEQIWNQVIYL